MKNKLEKQTGITLIALVITIIVLLILAGVAISMLAGDNGILKQAAKAKGETENATKEEESTLKDMEDLINENTGEYNYDAWYGDGTQTEYYIKNAIELCKLSEIVNSGKDDFKGKTVYLKSNINMKNAYDAGYTFEPIGTIDYRFSGTFDGQNHEISNFNIIKQGPVSGYDNYAGMFIWVLEGTIRNLGIVNSYFKGYKAAAFTSDSFESGTMENCWSKDNEIIGTKEAAGIVNCINYDAIVRNCYNSSSVTCLDSISSGDNPNFADRGAGGISSSGIDGKGYIYNCYNTGTITATNSVAGGIAGCSSQYDIIGCYNTGKVSSKFTGGIIGQTYDEGVQIKNCYNIGEITGSTYKGRNSWAIILGCTRSGVFDNNSIQFILYIRFNRECIRMCNRHNNIIK
ncbi:MAG: hypothetical protein HFJ17_01390 [Clostridia bacterium]|nr:hypothetical protein [Clostridia bacterium]